MDAGVHKFAGGYVRKFPAVRRQTCKLAARERRSTETDLVRDLGRHLPVPQQQIPKSLDKVGILRLTVARLKLRQLLGSSKGLAGTDFDLDPDALLHGGFLVVIAAADAEILYVSEGVRDCLGLSSWQITGCSMYEFVEPDDQADLKHLLAPADRQGNRRAAIVRLRYNLCIPQQRGLVIQLSGSMARGCFMGIARPIPHPTTPCALSQFHCDDDRMFKSTVAIRDSSTVIHIDPEMERLWGYTPDDLEGFCSLHFVHPGDSLAIMHYTHMLHTKGRVRTEPLRVLTKGGTVALVIFEATEEYMACDTTVITIRQFTIGEMEADGLPLQLPNSKSSSSPAPSPSPTPTSSPETCSEDSSNDSWTELYHELAIYEPESPGDLGIAMETELVDLDFWGAEGLLELDQAEFESFLKEMC